MCASISNIYNGIQYKVDIVSLLFNIIPNNSNNGTNTLQHRHQKQSTQVGKYVGSSFQSVMPSFTIHNSNTTYIYAYLVIEKNIKILSQALKKLLAKQKRFAFRKISDSNARLRAEKNTNFASTASQMIRNKKQNEKGTHQCVNPEALTGQLSNLCRKVVYQKAQKLFLTMNQLRTRSLLLGFTSFTSWNRSTGREISSQNSNAYEFQSNYKATNNGSRISNKRKTTRNAKGDQIKQNSHCNGSEFSVQNQRLRNELLSEDFQRQQFSQKMHELLDYHQKYLLQGSTTSRGKKQR